MIKVLEKYQIIKIRTPNSFPSNNIWDDPNLLWVYFVDINSIHVTHTQQQYYDEIAFSKCHILKVISNRSRDIILYSKYFLKPLYQLLMIFLIIKKHGITYCFLKPKITLGFSTQVTRQNKFSNWFLMVPFCVTSNIFCPRTKPI